VRVLGMRLAYAKRVPQRNQDSAGKNQTFTQELRKNVLFY